MSTESEEEEAVKSAKDSVEEWLNDPPCECVVCKGVMGSTVLAAYKLDKTEAAAQLVVNLISDLKTALLMDLQKEKKQLLTKMVNAAFE